MVRLLIHVENIDTHDYYTAMRRCCSSRCKSVTADNISRYGNTLLFGDRWHTDCIPTTKDRTVSVTNGAFRFDGPLWRCASQMEMSLWHEATASTINGL